MKFATPEDTQVTAQRILDEAAALGFTVDSGKSDTDINKYRARVDEKGESVVRLKVTQKKIDMFHGTRTREGIVIGHMTYRITSDHKAGEAIHNLSQAPKVRQWNYS